MMILRKPVDRDWPGFVMDFLLQLVFLFGLGSLSVWLWPDGILDTPVSMMSLGDWIWACACLISSAVFALAFYFIVVELGIALWKGLRTRKA